MRERRQMRDSIRERVCVLFIGTPSVTLALSAFTATTALFIQYQRAERDRVSESEREIGYQRER